MQGFASSGEPKDSKRKDHMNLYGLGIIAAVSFYV